MGKLASSDIPEEQINLINDLECKETEFVRLKRHEICGDDFELLTVFDNKAFGQVRQHMQKSSSFEHSFQYIIQQALHMLQQ